MAGLTLEFGVAGSIAPGERGSGDLGGVPLMAAISAIGHGEQAAATARLAADTLLRHPEDEPAALLMRCHAALRGTRGEVLSIASINLREDALSWVGIGNVSGLVCRGTASVLAARNELLARPGELGSGGLPPLGASVIPLRARDMLIFATDGISRHFSDDLASAASAQSLADDIIAHYCQRND